MILSPDGGGNEMNIRETPQTKPRYGIDPYLDWLAREGIPVTEDYGVSRQVDNAAAAPLRRGRLRP
jgi:hypothetical protein